MQKLIHWLEEGKGRAVMGWVLAALFIVGFSIYLSHRRYTGPADEGTFTQALVAVSLVDGNGFSTPVRTPQVVAFLEAHDVPFDPEEPLPELYHAPLYPLVLAGALAVLPEDFRAWLWEAPGLAAFRADFFLLAVNLLLFWLSCALLWLLARMLFNLRSAWVALGGYLLSVSVWEGVLGVTGLPLLVVLLLALLLVLNSVERRRREGRKALGALALAGALCGLLFLSDYTAGLVALPVAGYLLWAFQKGGRGIAVGLLALGFFVISGPWMAREVALAGSPVGLAWQEVALRDGDPTASPHEVRNAMSAELPPLSLRKTINKGLDGLKGNLRSGLWTGGALVFAAFFVAGLFYRFKDPATDALRWLAAAIVVMLLLGQPFLDNGLGERLPTQWVAPLIIVFGAGFFLILIESTAQRSELERHGLVAIVLLLQGLPLAHLVLEPPSRAYYAYPPYSPRLMHLMKTGLQNKFYAGFGLMADVPAGVAWYSGEYVWAQPAQYRDFDAVLQRQPIGALYLSPAVLDRPFFAELLQDGGKRAWDDPRRNFSWGAVYAGLPGRTTPSFLPLQKTLRIWDNTYVLMDVRALRPEDTQPSTASP